MLLVAAYVHGHSLVAELAGPSDTCASPDPLSGGEITQRAWAASDAESMRQALKQAESQMESLDDALQDVQALLGSLGSRMDGTCTVPDDELRTTGLVALVRSVFGAEDDIKVKCRNMGGEWMDVGELHTVMAVRKLSVKMERVVNEAQHFLTQAMLALTSDSDSDGGGACDAELAEMQQRGMSDVDFASQLGKVARALAHASLMASDGASGPAAAVPSVSGGGAVKMCVLSRSTQADCDAKGGVFGARAVATAAGDALRHLHGLESRIDQLKQALVAVAHRLQTSIGRSSRSGGRAQSGGVQATLCGVAKCVLSYNLADEASKRMVKGCEAIHAIVDEVVEEARGLNQDPAAAAKKEAQLEAMTKQLAQLEARAEQCARQSKKLTAEARVARESKAAAEKRASRAAARAKAAEDTAKTTRDKLRHTKASSSSSQTSLRRRAEGLERDLKAAREELQHAAAEVERFATEGKKRDAAVADARDEAKAARNQLDELLQQHSAMRKEFEALKREDKGRAAAVARAEQQRDEAAENLKRIKVELEALRANEKALREEVQRSETEDVEGKLRDAEARLRSCDGRVRELEVMVDSSTADASKAKAVADKALETLKALKAKEAERQEADMRAEEARARLAAQAREHTDEAPKRRAAEKRLAEVEGEVHKHQARAAKHAHIQEEAQRHAEALERTLEKAQKRADGLHASLKKAASERRAAKEEAQAAQAEARRLESDAEAARKQSQEEKRRVAELRKAFQDAQARVDAQRAELESEVKSKTVADERLSDERRKSARIAADLAEARKRDAERHEALDGAEKRLAELNEKLEASRRQKADAKAASDALKAKLRGALEEVQSLKEKLKEVQRDQEASAARAEELQGRVDELTSQMEVNGEAVAQARSDATRKADEAMLLRRTWSAAESDLQLAKEEAEKANQRVTSLQKQLEAAAAEKGAVAAELETVQNRNAALVKQAVKQAGDLDAADKRSREVASEAKAASARSKALSQELVAVKQERDAAHKKASAAEESLLEASREIDRLAAQAKKLESEVAAASAAREAAERRVKAIAATLEQKSAAVKAAEEQLERVSVALQEAEAGKRKQDAALAAVRASVKTKAEQVRAAEALNAKLKEALAAAEAQVKEAAAGRDEASRKAAELEQRLGEARDEVEAQRKHAARHRAARLVATAAHRRAAGEAESLRGEVAELRRQVADKGALKATADMLQEQKAALDASAKEEKSVAERLRKELEAATASREAAEGRLHAETVRLEELTSKHEAHVASEAELRRGLEQSKADLAARVEEVSGLERRLKEQAVVAEQLAASQSEVRRLTDVVQRLTAQQEETSASKEETEARAADLEERLRASKEEEQSLQRRLDATALSETGLKAELARLSAERAACGEEVRQRTPAVNEAAKESAKALTQQKKMTDIASEIGAELRRDLAKVQVRERELRDQLGASEQQVEAAEQNLAKKTAEWTAKLEQARAALVEKDEELAVKAETMSSELDAARADTRKAEKAIKEAQATHDGAIAELAAEGKRLNHELADLRGELERCKADNTAAEIRAKAEAEEAARIRAALDACKASAEALGVDLSDATSQEQCRARIEKAKASAAQSLSLIERLKSAGAEVDDSRDLAGTPDEVLRRLAGAGIADTAAWLRERASAVQKLHADQVALRKCRDAAKSIGVDTSSAKTPQQCAELVDAATKRAATALDAIRSTLREMHEDGVEGPEDTPSSIDLRSGEVKDVLARLVESGNTDARGTVQWQQRRAKVLKDWRAEQERKRLARCHEAAASHGLRVPESATARDCEMHIHEADEEAIGIATRIAYVMKHRFPDERLPFGEAGMQERVSAVLKATQQRRGEDTGAVLKAVAPFSSKRRSGGSVEELKHLEAALNDAIGEWDAVTACREAMRKKGIDVKESESSKQCREREERADAEAKKLRARVLDLKRKFDASDFDFGHGDEGLLSDVGVVEESSEGDVLASLLNQTSSKDAVINNPLVWLRSMERRMTTAAQQLKSLVTCREQADAKGLGREHRRTLDACQSFVKRADDVAAGHVRSVQNIASRRRGHDGKLVFHNSGDLETRLQSFKAAVGASPHNMLASLKNQAVEQPSQWLAQLDTDMAHADSEQEKLDQCRTDAAARGIDGTSAVTSEQCAKLIETEESAASATREAFLSMEGKLGRRGLFRDDEDLKRRFEAVKAVGSPVLLNLARASAVRNPVSWLEALKTEMAVEACSLPSVPLRVLEAIARNVEAMKEDEAQEAIRKLTEGSQLARDIETVLRVLTPKMLAFLTREDPLPVRADSDECRAFDGMTASLLDLVRRYREMPDLEVGNDFWSQLDNTVLELLENVRPTVRVYARIKPLSAGETSAFSEVTDTTLQTDCSIDGGGDQRVKVYRVFDNYSNAEVFSGCREEGETNTACSRDGFQSLFRNALDGGASGAVLRSVARTPP